ncbi:hypothetical protein CO610_01650 [Lysobacteraceae bacterium NML95-0200]|nr:hypothetical protein CO610_01650 [Xanthomonadaceae bacterium NML95-0200]
MYPVYHGHNPVQAHLLKHRLEAVGIPAFVLGEALLGGMGELPAAGFIRVCVPDDFAEAAANALAGWDAEASDAVGAPLPAAEGSLLA